ncbi:LIN54 [Lepeophtheirus salmonis]|uniref:LIN54 n=1 Tax=Lepeophtheirus salmonis TaxID=72036 RepID=A0A7R8CUZ4_LEPSM|nr:LIN54 [Lepeophtheirus salmonis]CAF2940681.1 LIN54 [Lepeophtheirus salmonis]
MKKKLIAKALQFLAKFGFPQDREDCKDMVRSYLNCIGCKNVFRDNRSRKDWMVLFEKRHCHMLTSRKPELLTRARAEGLSEGVINLFFDHYINLLKDNGLNESPHRIFQS